MTLKTKKDRRKVVADMVLIETLKQHQEKISKKLGDDYKDKHFIFA